MRGVVRFLWAFDPTHQLERLAQFLLHKKRHASCMRHRLCQSLWEWPSQNERETLNRISCEVEMDDRMMDRRNYVVRRCRSYL